MNFREQFCKENNIDNLTPQHSMFKYYTYWLENKLKEASRIGDVIESEADSFTIKPLCVCDENKKQGISSWWCNACKTDWA